MRAGGGDVWVVGGGCGMWEWWEVGVGADVSVVEFPDRL